jgi:hypothetical protein
MSSVARWAGYGAFVMKGLLRAALRTLAVMIALMIALLGVYILGVWLYYTEPWYDHAVITQLTRVPHTAPLEDVSERAAQIFPDGMSRRAATALLQANGFACESYANESISGASGLNCQREAHVPLCAGYYMVKLAFDGEERLSDRSATSYLGCL